MQHALPERPNGNRPVAIEVDGEPLGVLVPEEVGFRFLAVKLNAFKVDGERFDSVEAAREALSLAVSSGD